MREFIRLGKKIYDMNNPREVRRMIVFVGRSCLHSVEMKELMEWFAADAIRQEIMDISPFPLEQVTRAFFYNESTFSERVHIVKEHITFLQKIFRDEWVLRLTNCYGRAFEIWQNEYEEKKWNAIMRFEAGQRKEGLLSVELNLGQEHLYQIMFWCAKDREQRDALWIGALQGPNMENARDIIKKITKRCFAYRTKNLILYMTQAAARAMGIERIYAVTNYGYYANNHIRSDRKLKTNFEDFWTEAGGRPTADKRFYELPLVEPRKTMEEVPTRKRAVYRKRFEFLDTVDADIEANMRKILK